MKKKEQQARLENWRIIPLYGRMILYGEIYDDITNRFEDGTFIRSSIIESVNVKSHTVSTMNTVYELGGLQFDD